MHLRILVDEQRHAGAVHQHQFEAAEQELRADGDDQRGNVEARHQEAVEQAAGDAGRRSGNQAEPPRRAAVIGDEAEDRRAERHHGRKRQVDLAGDDDEGQRQRDDAE